MDEKTQALIQAISTQRNMALDSAANLFAQIHVLQKTIADLQEELKVAKS